MALRVPESTESATARPRQIADREEVRPILGPPMRPRHAHVELTADDARAGALRIGDVLDPAGGPVSLELVGPAGGRTVAATPADGAVRAPEIANYYDRCGLRPGDKLLVRRTGRRSARASPLPAPFRFIDLFAGIGGFRLGFEAAGGTCAFSSEIDEQARDTYEANFGHRPAGDITKIDAADVPAHDVLLGGFPCQPFSVIGDRKGFGDVRGTLFFHIARILKHRKPAAAVLENVKQFRTHDGGRTCATVVRTLEELGYTVTVEVLNALDYSVAQKRERTFIVALRDPAAAAAFRWPAPYPERADLADVLEPDAAVPEKLWASDYIRKKRRARLAEQGKTAFAPSIWHENKGGNLGVHPHSCALRAGASYSYLLVNGARRPTGRELLRLQGFPEEFRTPVPHAALRKQCGNSVAVPAVMEMGAGVCGAVRGRLRKTRVTGTSSTVH